MTLPSLSACVVVLALAAPLHAADKGKKPKLDLRVVPRMGFSPLTAFFTAELVGGDDVEEFHCPEVEWEWGDEGKSVQESDCAPYEAGGTIERRFTAEHTYRRAGVYTAKATLRRSNRTLASQTIRVTVRPGLGDPSN